MKKKSDTKIKMKLERGEKGTEEGHKSGGRRNGRRRVWNGKIRVWRRS